MGDQVCARQSSQFMSQAGAHSLPSLTLVRGYGKVLRGLGTHTVLGRPPPVHVLSSSLKRLFTLISSTAIPGCGPF